jgi:hypothetical protein
MLQFLQTALFGNRGAPPQTRVEPVPLALVSTKSVTTDTGVVLHQANLLSFQSGSWFKSFCVRRSGRLVWGGPPERVEAGPGAHLTAAYEAAGRMDGSAAASMLSPYIVVAPSPVEGALTTEPPMTAEEYVWSLQRPAPKVCIPDAPSPGLKLALSLSVHNNWPVLSPVDGVFLGKRMAPSAHWTHGYRECRVFAFRDDRTRRIVNVPCWTNSKIRLPEGSRVRHGDVVAFSGAVPVPEDTPQSPDRFWRDVMANRVNSIWKSPTYRGAAARMALNHALLTLTDEGGEIDLVPADLLNEGIADVKNIWVSDEADEAKPAPLFLLGHLENLSVLPEEAATELGVPSGGCLYKLPEFRPASRMDARLTFPGPVEWDIW